MRFYPVSGSGGGGVTSSDVTVTKYDIPKSLTALTSDSNDEVVSGLLEERSLEYEGANSKDDDAQKVYLAIPTRALYTTGAKLYVSYTDLRSLIGLSAGNIATGSTILGAEGTYKGLGNAVVSDVRKGKTFSTGSLSNATGTLEVSSVVSFSTAVSGVTVTLKWQWPSKGPYGGVIIRVKEGGYPTSVSDGSQAYRGTGSTSALSGTSTATWTASKQNTTYYFRLWVYCDTSQGTLYSGNKDTTARTSTLTGSQTFTSGGTFTVPTAVTQIKVFVVGGGGAGGSKPYSNNQYGTGGGGGYTKTGTFNVSPGAKYTVTIGAGGTPHNQAAGGDGGTTSFGSLISAAGGNGGIGGYRGGDGGSGGGGSQIPDEKGLSGFAGGSNGSDGGAFYDNDTYKSKGQGSTTRAFGEGSGTLYSGGGGGTCYGVNVRDGGDGAGGAGGGTSGGRTSSTSASANTGGGSGGVCNGTPGYGGSGICIVRWGY